METQAAPLEDGPALAWLEAQGRSVVLRSSLSRGVADGAFLGDLLLADPAKAVDVVDAAFEEAQAQGAAADVCAYLEQWRDRVRAGADEANHLGYTRERLGRLVGVRDADAIMDILRSAIAEAPDEANKSKLSDIAAAALEHIAPTPSGSTRMKDRCWECCGGFCAMCGLMGGGGAGCVICCVVGCYSC